MSNTLQPTHSKDMAIRVYQAFAVDTLSPTETLAAAAVAPQGSQDPVDQALVGSLKANRPDLTPEYVDAAHFELATPERRYSVAHTDTADIIRGDMDSVVEASVSNRAQRALLRKNARAMHKLGWRCLGVAVAEKDLLGNVGEMRLQGFVALAPVSAGKLAADVRDNPSDWVRVELWPAALRWQHWINLFLIILLTVTGYYIMDPFFGQQPGQDTGYLMGWIRFAHIAAGFAWIVLALWRVWLLCVSKQRQNQWRSLWPIYSKEDAKNILRTAQHYLFLGKEEPPLYIGHNGLQQISYSGIYGLCILQIISGMALYALAKPATWYWDIVRLPVDWFGVPWIRLGHALIMFIIWVFVVIHVYLVIRADSVEKHSGLSAMLNGGLWLHRGGNPVDGPRIG